MTADTLMNTSNLLTLNKETNISLTPSMNESDEADSHALEPPFYIVFTSTLLYCLIFLIGVLGNILVVVVITFSRTMKTTVNKYLLNLCVADLLVIIICMPTALTDIYTKEVWYFGEFMCKFVPFLENTVANASVLTILAISFERYRVVCHPLKVIGSSMIKIWMYVAFIWLISSLSSIPWFLIPVLRPSELMDGTPIMVCRNPIIRSWQKMYVIGFSVAFFLIPCLFMVVLYTHLCLVLNRSIHGRNDDERSLRSRRKETKQKTYQVANTIVSIVAVFFICQLPIRVVALWFSFADKNEIWKLGLEKFLLILYSTRIMFYLNHALNPVVYNFVSSKFRTAFKAFCINVKNCGCHRTTNLGHRLSIETPRSNKVILPHKLKTYYVKNNRTLSVRQNSNEPKNPRQNLVGATHGSPTNQIVFSKDSENNALYSSSSTSNNGYRLRIEIENKEIAIHFKMKRIRSEKN